MTKKETSTQIIIGFSKPKSKPFPVFSWVIRLFERTEYSHVYIRWHSRGAGVDVAYHASGTQVHFLGEKAFRERITPVEEYARDISSAEYRELLKFCMTHAGVDYGLKGVLGVAIDVVFRRGNPFASGGRSQWCSKLIGALLDLFDDFIDDAILERAGPKKINDLIRQRADFRRIL